MHKHFNGSSLSNELGNHLNQPVDMLRQTFKTG